MSTAALHTHDRHDGDFSKLLHESFARAVAGHGALFTTDAADLNDLYLDSLPSDRQFHNCSCCRRFIRTYGGLVTIDDQGITRPVMWSTGDESGYLVPPFYLPVFAALWQRVAKAKVTGVFLSKETTWGTPEAGGFTHFAVTPPAALVYRERALTPRQAMAAARENLKTVAVALGEFKPAVLDEALRLLKAESLARSEKFVAPVQWLRDLLGRPKGPRGQNLLWRAVALAPEGFCHPRSSVVGSLLEDIEAGMDFQTVKKRFNAKLGPLQYQRPQAAPSAGNIKAAEALVEKLGVQRSLERRFARFDELRTIWQPRPKETPATSSLFGHLTPKDADVVKPLDLPAQTMTWDKFSRTILPAAEEMEILVPYMGNFAGILTAEHADAPPILKWDHEDERNPLSAYVYNGGSPATQWKLQPSRYTRITGVTLQPNMYGSRPMPQTWQGVVLIIDGAADTRQNMGNALFPEILKSELHAVRSTIEAYSKRAVVGGREQASACGVTISKNGKSDTRLRVRAGGAWADYHIDRWD